jgi:hypothetical protein
LKLSVVAAEPYLGAWIGTLAALGLAAGLALFFWFIIIEGGYPSFPAIGQVIMWYVCFGWSMIAMLATPVLLLTRRRFVRLERYHQLTISIFAWVGNMAAFLALAILIAD